MIVLLAVLLVLQLRSDRPANAASGPWEGVRGLRLLAAVHKEIRERYRNPPTDQELFTAAIQGMLSRLDDPYSAFMAPQTRRQVDFLMDSKEVGGIGVLPRFEPGVGVVVQETVPGGPAEKAGIAPDDVILRIDNAATSLLTRQQVYERLQGEVDTPVELQVRSPDGAIREVRINRAPLPRPRSVSFRMLPGEVRVGLVRLFTFSDDVAARTREAVQEMEQAGAQAIVLDLRWNSGGSFSQGVAVADLFLAGGVITVTERRRPGQEEADRIEETFAASERTVTDLPLVVLVNGMSASSSELAAAALQDNGRAPLVGTTTVGKGRFQEVTSLGQTGGALVLTVGRFLTPNGRDIQQRGILPDQVVALTEEQSQRIGKAWVSDWYGLRRALLDSPEDDPQLAAALAAARAAVVEERE